jgi:hypothetical protein
MGFLMVFDGMPRVVPLASTTLVGRGGACLARIGHPAVPMHWLEVRWMGERWAWRALAAEDSTRGPSAFLAAGWRTLGSVGRVARVSLGETAWVELADPSPPAPFVWDLARGQVLEDEVRARHLEVRGGGFRLLSAEGEPGALLADGVTVAVNDAEHGPLALRLHAPTDVISTLHTVVDLLRPGLTADFDLVRLRAKLHQGDAAVTVTGECVRVLYTYVQARRRDHPAGGWLDPFAAWHDWVALGGNASSPADRLSWERGKLRSQLSRIRVANIDALFELSREGDTIRTRVGVEIREL